MRKKVRAIAFYLPQFHPVPENDAWWGPGFTEWTNTAKAKPLFRGHYQPHVPADLGFYDLRLPEARVAQAAMAREYGIEGFCYYHYWFGGKRILERPFEEVLESGKPDFPFCLCWANETWTGVWHGLEKQILIEQTYPEGEDLRQHIEYLVRAFCDPRYMKIEGKPIFLVYRPLDIPILQKFVGDLRRAAEKAGLSGVHLVGVVTPRNWQPDSSGFDASARPLLSRRNWVSLRHPVKWLRHRYRKLSGKPIIRDYRTVLPELLPPRVPGITEYPCVFPNWDNTPRCGSNGIVLHGSTPELFRLHLRQALDLTDGVPPEGNLLFIKSWNEWAEGNHLEPDLRYGRAYLEVLHEELIGAGA
ncbi:glycoside hydrolase family 99-like domain-containing protein [Geomonas sp. RF6]|uniref:glycosyltransferase WbsX family protein n=1 Tax=Geomonas sp. RF6 TaxID=2897342 RepID=UPI001E4EBA75|nr:glycoside hydrolase family 99-like domain-containing protein [Geomonas sp. RF6]UFS69111.1 glycoside hydrolase family 99-like domain-containing protein [Geomonas sp. RF6]